MNPAKFKSVWVVEFFSDCI